MRIRGGVRAAAGGIAAGRDVLIRLVEETHHTFFVGRYQRLAEAYIDASEMFDLVGVADFAGREWLAAELDEFLMGEGSGYFVVEAAAGVGKTAFLAHLVTSHGWAHHFCELTPGEAGVVRARLNLAAQLTRAFELGDGHSEPVLSEAAAERPDFLRGLLREAAERRTDGEKVVVAIDALDEAGARLGENVIGLPRLLPEGVFVVATKRPVPVPLATESARRVVSIDPASKENRDDIRDYLERIAARADLASLLERDGLSAADFAEQLAKKSGGLWIYLRYALQRIAETGAEGLGALPQGLWGWYYRFWRTWKDDHPREWHRVYLPLLATIAAARTDFTLEEVCTHADIDPLPELPAAWRPYLLVTRHAARRYRFYHASLADFFHSSAATGDVAEQDFAHELSAATCAANGRMADRYLDAWGGLARGLEGLLDPSLRDMDDRYGLRHVAEHLVAADRRQSLHDLLRIEFPVGDAADGRGASGWFAAWDSVTLSGYLADLATAWYAAEADSDRAVREGRDAAAVGLEIRYVVLTASVRNVAGNLPPELVAALVARGRWTEERGVAYAQAVTNPDRRALMLFALAGAAGEPRRRALVDQAVSSATLVEEDLSDTVLMELAALAPGDEPCEAFVAALPRLQRMRHALPRARALAAILSRIPPRHHSAVAEALAATVVELPETTQDGLVPEIVPELPPHVVVELWEHARRLHSPPVQMLVALAVALPDGAQRAQGLREALAAVSEERSMYGPAVKLLAELAPHLPPDLLEEAVDVARARHDPAERVAALAALLPRLEEPARSRCVEEAVATADEVSSDRDRAKAHVALAPALGAEGWRRALVAARSISFEPQRAEALALVVPQLHDPERSAIALEAVAAARADAMSWTARDLVKLIPSLPLAEAPDALVDALTDAMRDEALAPAEAGRLAAAIAVHLGEPGRTEALERLLECAPAFPFESERAELLARVAPIMPPPAVAEAVELLRPLRDQRARAELTAALAPWASPDALERLLYEARAIGDVDARWLAAAGFASRLPEAERAAALEPTLAVAGDVDDLVSSTGLAGIAGALPAELLGAAIAAAGTVSQEWMRRDALRSLAAHPAAVDRRDDLASAFHMLARKSTGLDQPCRLADLADWLPADERAECLREGLERARAIEEIVWPDDGDEPYGRIHHPPGHRERPIDRCPERAAALTAVGRRMAEPERAQALAEAHETATRIEDEWERVHALAKLTSVLPDRDRDAAMSHARAALATVVESRYLTTIDDRAPLAIETLLQTLASAEREAVAHEVLEATRDVYDAGGRARAAASVAAYVAPAERQAAFDRVLRDMDDVDDGVYRIAMVRRLARALLLLPPQPLYGVWSQLLPLLAGRTRAGLLADFFALSPVAAHIGGEDAIREALDAVRDAGAWMP